MRRAYFSRKADTASSASAHRSIGPLLTIAKNQDASIEPVALIDAPKIAERDPFQTLSLPTAFHPDRHFQNQPIAGAEA